MSKYHPYKTGADWGFFIGFGLFVALMVGLLLFCIWAARQEITYDEPTSRCIDSKYRIFERGNEEGFSVVEDASCAQ